MVHVMVWRFDVKPTAVDAFLGAYGSDGDWARLFATADGFLGTELFRSEADPRRFVTVDTWSDIGAWEDFRRRRAEEYAALDQRCAAYTVAEQRIA
jgi:quinol monooxygenase YgiN